VKLLTYRPDVEPKSIESYRNSKLPRDPEVWEDNINKYVYNFQYHNNHELLNLFLNYLIINAIKNVLIQLKIMILHSYC